MNQVRTRIAPSPTGFAHIGTIYQVLFDFAFAKKHGGQFIVRIEDTDRSRFVEGAEEVVYKSLEWFALEPDESPVKGGPYQPYRSSDRLDIYKKYAEELVEKGHAYYCFCTPERLTAMRDEQQKMSKQPKYDKQCQSLSTEQVKANLDSGMARVIRLNVPQDQKIKFHDEIAGDIEIDSNQVDDQVLMKSDGFPTYHLAVVVDDYLMKISHIFRGTEWVPSMPKHILLYQFLGWGDEMPKFIHLPLILNSDAPGKLSKRNAAASVDFYKTEGYLPEAILNYLSNIVWNHPEEKEIYSFEEFTKLFEIEDLQPKGAKFDLRKLDWMNGEYIRKMSDKELTKRLMEYLSSLPVQSERVEESIENKPESSKKEVLTGITQDKVAKLVPLVKERMKKLSDFVPMTAWMFEGSEYDKAIFAGLKIDNLSDVMDKIVQKLESLEKPWKKEQFEETFQTLAKDLSLNNSQMFQLLRVAVSGQLVTPPMFESMQILGEDETIKRVTAAKEFLI